MTYPEMQADFIKVSKYTRAASPSPPPSGPPPTHHAEVPERIFGLFYQKSVLPEADEIRVIEAEANDTALIGEAGK